MRVAIDLSAVKTTGTKVYCAGFMSALGRVAVTDEFVVFESPQARDAIGDRVPGNFRRLVVNPGGNGELRILWQQIVMPRYLRQWKVDFLFAPFDIAPLLSPCPILLAVRNPTPIILARGMEISEFSRVRAHAHRLLAYLSCQKADLVFYPSMSAARVLGEMMGVPAKKRAVVYHGLDYEFWCAPREPHGLARYGVGRGRYVLYVSALARHKAPDVLIDGFARWRKGSGARDYKLILAGMTAHRGWGRMLHKQAYDLGLENAAVFAGEVPRSDLPALYQHAAVFVLPSAMETFGHPFVEAMASGVPAICADTDCAHEICGGAARYFPPGDADAVADALQTVMSNPSIRARMREEGRRRATMFSWEREAAETLALMRQLGSSSRKDHPVEQTESDGTLRRIGNRVKHAEYEE